MLRERLARVRDRMADRYLEFKPRIIDLPLGDPRLRFFVGTPQAAGWYDPPRAHNVAEFEWIMQRLAGRTEMIVDAGAYHGLYTLVMAASASPRSEVVAIDPVPPNCALIEVNLALNGLQARIENVAVAERDDQMTFSGGSCGRIIHGRGPEQVEARRLVTLLPHATVVKLDIEGAEFAVLPAAIDELPEVHTWIVEIHPEAPGSPETIIDSFHDRGYQLSWVNRSAASVQPWQAGLSWTERTSLLAVR